MYWRCPKHILKEGEQNWEITRKKWHILVEGKDCLPPLQSFHDMKFPTPILDALKDCNIKCPTPIQMQGLPVTLA
eukprot:3472331-Ditylum_brightwellii.AAC.1